MTGILSCTRRKPVAHAPRGVWRAGRSSLLGLAILLAGAAIPAQAQDALETRRTETAKALEALTGEISISSERLTALDSEIAALKKDQTSITAALIQSAKTEKKLAEDITGIGERLDALREQEDSIRLSLKSRKAVLAEVLAALQRMGLNPPPAILVRPDDALSSVRSAVLLGAVVPEMRAETQVLIVDLKEMTRVRTSISSEQEKLTATRNSQAEEQRKLSLLLAEKQKLQAGSETQLAAEQAKSEQLAARAKTLKDLIASIEKEADAVKDAASAARQVEQDHLTAGLDRADRLSPDQNRLQAEANFVSLKSRIGLPAAGKLTRHFGEADGLGGSSMGDTLETVSGATVTAPIDANVLYAGQFRSYGQLLILDAGGGYHVVLAGMKRINVSQNQFVLAGEPIGAMGEQLVASAASIELGTGAPVLYIEFRKDGKPVNPAPWWAERLGRTDNDT